MDMDNIKTTPLSIGSLREGMERIMNESVHGEPPLYLVCLDDWRKIRAYSDEHNCSHFHAYLELSNTGKVRPAIQS